MKEVEYSDLSEGFLDFLKSPESVMKQVCDEILQAEKNMIDTQFRFLEKFDSIKIFVSGLKRMYSESLTRLEQEKTAKIAEIKSLGLKGENKIIAAYSRGKRLLENARDNDEGIKLEKIYKTLVRELNEEQTRSVFDYDKILTRHIRNADVQIAGNMARQKYYNERRSTEKNELFSYRTRKREAHKNFIKDLDISEIIASDADLHDIYDTIKSVINRIELETIGEISTSSVVPSTPEPGADDTKKDSTGSRFDPISSIDSDEEDDFIRIDHLGGPDKINEYREEDDSETGIPEETEFLYGTDPGKEDPFAGMPFKLKPWKNISNNVVDNYYFLIFGDDNPKVLFNVDISGIDIPFMLTFAGDNTSYGKGESFPEIKSQVVALPCFGLREGGVPLKRTSILDITTSDITESTTRYYSSRIHKKSGSSDSLSLNTINLKDFDNNSSAVESVVSVFRSISQYFADNFIEKGKDGKNIIRDASFYKNRPHAKILAQSFGSQKMPLIRREVNETIRTSFAKGFKDGKNEQGAFDYLLSTDPKDLEGLGKKKYNIKFESVVIAFYRLIGNSMSLPLKKGADASFSEEPKKEEKVEDKDFIEGKEIEKDEKVDFEKDDKKDTESPKSSKKKSTKPGPIGIPKPPKTQKINPGDIYKIGDKEIEITGVDEKKVKFNQGGVAKEMSISRFNNQVSLGKIVSFKKKRKKATAPVKESLTLPNKQNKRTTMIKNFHEFNSPINEGFFEDLGGSIRRGIDQAIGTDAGKLKQLSQKISTQSHNYLDNYADIAHDYTQAYLEFKKDPSDANERSLELHTEDLKNLQRGYGEMIDGFYEEAKAIYTDKKGMVKPELKTAFTQHMAIEIEKIRKKKNDIEKSIAQMKRAAVDKVFDETPTSIEVKRAIEQPTKDFKAAILKMAFSDILKLKNELQELVEDKSDEIRNLRDVGDKSNSNKITKIQNDKAKAEDRIKAIQDLLSGTRNRRTSIYP